jgi:transmembrane sensor
MDGGTFAMTKSETPLESLGAKVAATLEQFGEERDRAIEDARQQFSLHAARRPKPEGSMRRALVIGLAAALSGFAIWFSLASRAASLQFKVDGASGVAGTWLAAPAERSLVVAFSEGTSVEVQPLSRARVIDTDAHGASVALESGSLSAKVVHKPQGSWHLIAGPFAVRVTGTRFDLRWDSAIQRFSVTVREGSVGVAGPLVGAERPVSAGQTLVASVIEGRLEMIDGTEGRARSSIAGESAAAEAVDGGASSPESAELPPTPSTATGPSSGGWRDFAKSGNLRQAFAVADARGFQGVCETATPAELLLLGDAARLSERPDRAAEALLTLRRKFPHDPRRAAAAFALGKVAFDQRRAYGQAAEWFATCVREQPAGPLVREAYGRRIEALRNAGDATGAQLAAREYLSRYPDGPHADIARSTLK